MISSISPNKISISPNKKATPQWAPILNLGKRTQREPKPAQKAQVLKPPQRLHPQAKFQKRDGAVFKDYGVHDLELTEFQDEARRTLRSSASKKGRKLPKAIKTPGEDLIPFNMLDEDSSPFTPNKVSQLAALILDDSAEYKE